MKYSTQEQDYYGYIYITLNQKHNKVYVGQKKGKIENSEDYFGSGTRITNIKKDRGTYFLKKTVLGVCYSKEELKYWETECKHFFNVWDRLYGYNIAVIDDGGDNITFHPEKERIQLQISLTQRLKTSILTEEDRKILIAILNDYKNGFDPLLLKYKDWLAKKEQEHIDSLLTSEERGLLVKSIWENKSDEDKKFLLIKW